MTTEETTAEQWDYLDCLSHGFQAVHSQHELLSELLRCDFVLVEVIKKDSPEHLAPAYLCYYYIITSQQSKAENRAEKKECLRY